MLTARELDAHATSTALTALQVSRSERWVP
jgi:hypothetical protein